MYVLPPAFRTASLTALLLVGAICASRLEAQEDSRDNNPTKSVALLIEYLGADCFKVRLSARDTLKDR